MYVHDICYVYSLPKGQSFRPRDDTKCCRSSSSSSSSSSAGRGRFAGLPWRGRQIPYK